MLISSDMSKSFRNMGRVSMRCQIKNNRLSGHLSSTFMKVLLEQNSYNWETTVVLHVGLLKLTFLSGQVPAVKSLKKKQATCTVATPLKIYHSIFYSIYFWLINSLLKFQSP